MEKELCYATLNYATGARGRCIVVVLAGKMVVVISGISIV